MALKQYGMEGGTEGATATAALTGAVLMSNPNLEGTVTFRAASKNSGQLGIRMAAGPNHDITSRWAFDAPSYQVALSFNFRTLQLPPTPKMLALLMGASSNVWRITLRDGKLYTDGSVVTGDTAVGVTISPNVWYRIEAVIDVIAGTAKIRVYEGNGLTSIGPGVTVEGMNLGSAMATMLDVYGNRSTTVDLDDVRLFSNSTAWPGPARSPLAPDSTVRPWDMVDNSGGYSAVGTTDFTTAVADNSDSTYVESISSPVNTAIMFILNPLTLGPVTVNLRHSATSASPVITRTIRLLQGTTLIAQRATTLPTSVTAYSFTTTTSETNLLEWPRDNLYLEIKDSAL